jgi:alkylated DNA repair dioxygenase AlkB
MDERKAFVTLERSGPPAEADGVADMGGRGGQAALFELDRDLPHGLVYQPGFITRTEEAELLSHISTLPFEEAHYQQYTARRRVVSFGEREPEPFNDRAQESLNPRRPFPAFLMPLRSRLAHWRGFRETRLANALITEYRPGAPIGWHRDAPPCDVVIGVSLASAARMRFRPCDAPSDPKAVFTLLLEPCSAYVMQGDIRWHWQHHIPPAKQLRYSITLRTLGRVFV